MSPFETAQTELFPDPQVNRRGLARISPDIPHYRRDVTPNFVNAESIAEARENGINFVVKQVREMIEKGEMTREIIISTPARLARLTEGIRNADLHRCLTEQVDPHQYLIQLQLVRATEERRRNKLEILLSPFKTPCHMKLQRSKGNKGRELKEVA